MRSFTIILFFFIVNFSYSQGEGTEIEIMIAPVQDTCTNSKEETYTCFKAKKTTDPHWTFHIPIIENFKYEKGYIYTLKLLLKRTEETQKDGGHAEYSLVEILKKESI